MKNTRVRSGESRDRTELEVELLLPGIHDTKDRCVARLNDLIESRAGIDRVHLREVHGKPSNRICVHFDPTSVSVGEIRQWALQAGAELSQRYGHLLLKTGSMDARRARRVEDQLKQIDGVLDSGVSADGMMRIEFDTQLTDESAILATISHVGLSLKDDLETQHEHGHCHDESHDHGRHKPGVAHAHQHGGVFGERSELIFAAICGSLLLVAWSISFVPSIPATISWAFYAAAYFFGGYYIVREAFEKILMRRFEIDFLMIVAAIGAAVLGAWAEGALLLFLFAIGHALENYVMGRARKAIEALADLAPVSAIVRRNGNTVEVPVEELKRGDIVIIKPNDRLAADGFVVKGQSSVNQAPITGESVPVDKRPVDDPEQAAANPEKLAPENRVFAGTINERGSLEIQVTQPASDSTLARVIKMVNEAETQQSPTQQFTDRFERYFVPVVIAVVIMLLFAFLVVDEPFFASFYRAMAVLVAASPCALAIATPSAVLSGVARAARGGVLIKGGGPLENLGRLTAIAFDKTGTLTEGKPRMTDVVSYGGTTEEELLLFAIAVEQLSDHPLAAAVVRDGGKRLESRVESRGQNAGSSGSRHAEPVSDSAMKVSNLESITGRGIKATVNGQPFYIGKVDLFAEVGGAPLPDDLRLSVERLESDGRTTMIVRRDDQYLGVIGLMDTPRGAAREVIAKLRELGIERMIMISGDNQQVVNAVARQVGIDDAWGDLMPDDKVAAIRRLRAERDVAMVGDGVNDAPAMANATVGIAMGAAGSEIALETADVALMADNLSHLPFAVGLSRQTSRIIRQNLWYSLGMVAFLVPATIFGLGLGFAVLFHEGSTLVVVFNALRLLVYQPK